MLLESFQCVLGTSGGVAAGGRCVWGNSGLIEPDQKNERSYEDFFHVYFLSSLFRKRGE